MPSKQIASRGIVLGRVNFGEADRIITVLTVDQGKQRLLAKGVRKQKSKLAGGIELLSTSDITFMAGAPSSIGRLVSARLQHHYAHITHDIVRTMLAYELLKLVHRVTDDHTDPAHYELLETALEALNQPTMPTSLVEIYTIGRLLALEGRSPNLQTDIHGAALQAETRYVFSFDDGCCAATPHGSLTGHEIKIMRLVFRGATLETLQRIEALDQHLTVLGPLFRQLQRAYLIQ